MTGGRSLVRNAPFSPGRADGEGAQATESEWRLPSGEDLISFALATGIAAGPLLEAGGGSNEPSGSASSHSAMDEWVVAAWASDHLAKRRV